MNPLDFDEYKLIKNRTEILNKKNLNFAQNNNYKKFNLPKSFYFKILNDRCKIHWAVIMKETDKFCIYFINVFGQAFDKLEFKNINIAKRLLRKNKFISNNNKKCPYMPVEPIFIKLNIGKKSAPYSKGNLWRKQERYNIEAVSKKSKINFFNKIFKF